MVGDRSYDSNDVRASLLPKVILQGNPPKSNRKEPIACDFRAYWDRNRVERMLNMLKQFRRIFTRHDKITIFFFGLIAISTVKIWIQILVSRVNDCPASRVNTCGSAGRAFLQ